MKSLRILGLSILFLVAAVYSYAAEITTCTLSSVNLTSITSVLAPGDGNLLSTNYDATSCVGVFLGENDDSGSLSNPDPNIGQYEDGLLNGESFKGIALFDGLEFINEEDLQALDGDGIFDDPGWIHLANIDPAANKTTYSSSGPNPTGDPNLILDIGDLLSIDIDCNNSSDCTSGNWTLTTKLDVIEQAQALLGAATFDHLAFSFKAGNAFAVYDFNFKTIFANEHTINPGSQLNFLTPYSLSGGFSMLDFLNKKDDMQGISHINIWARDPSDTTTTVIPEPSTLILLGAGLAGLGYYSRRRKKD